TNIILFQKLKPQETNKFKAVTVDSTFEITKIEQYLKEKSIQMEQSKLDDKTFVLADDRTLALKQKIEEIGKPLKDWDVKIYRGVITGFNEAFIIDTETKDRILKNCKDEDERKRTKEILKPILRGRDIGRYYYRWAGLWLIKIESGWTNKNRGKNKPEEFFKMMFPALYNHLISFANLKTEETRRKGLLNRDDQGDYWWELRDCDYYPEFEKEKIVWQEMSQEPSFAYDRDSYFTNQTAYIATGKLLKYIIGILNSNVSHFYLLRIAYSLSNQANRWIKQYVEQIPLPTITPQNQHIAKKIESLVSKILSITQSDDYLSNSQKQEKVKELENEINKLVFELYDLTPEEIKIIKSEIEK
ncbi:MAG: hypothetical protein N2712_07990, partial [Brevinematales bacterium]|nr:hypothetical protein [Brevinematales bacterium]